MDGKRVYTTKDVQEMLGCGKAQAYKIMNSDTFPSFKIGRRMYVSVKEFEKYLDQCKFREIIL